MKTYLFFDVDGVLIEGFHAKSCYRKRWDSSLEADLGINPTALESAFFNGVFQEYVLLGKKALLPVLTEILPTIGFHENPQTLIDYWMRKDANLNASIMPYIEQLAKMPKVHLYLATNQEHTRAHYLMEEVGLRHYFKDIFYSAKIGCLKNDPQFYRCVNNALNIKDEPCIFFDDAPINIQTANAFGWNAFLFNETKDLLKPELMRLILRGIT